MKQTSNKLFDYHGHIGCRNLIKNFNKLEMGLAITTMQQQSNLLGSRYDAPRGRIIGIAIIDLCTALIFGLS